MRSVPAVAFLILAAGCIQPMTDIERVAADPSWEPGTVEVDGRIARLEALELDGAPWWRVELETGAPLPFLGPKESPLANPCTQVLVPATEPLAVGQTLRTTLRFESTTYNGDPAVLAANH